MVFWWSSSVTALLVIILGCGAVYAGNVEPTREVLVASGNFTLNGEIANIAEFDLSTGIWSRAYTAGLFLNGDTNGVIWDIVKNHSYSTKSPASMIVVGAFDTIAKTSQLQFCSVSKFDGFSFEKFGEGLCPRGGDSSSAIQILAAAVGHGGDIFVGGSFESRVWDGHSYVALYHVAYFDATSSSWLPLAGGHLECTTGEYPR